jgi:glycosyltransferase involved in cell wall biosynthesis
MVNAIKKCFGRTVEIEVCALENSRTQLQYPPEVRYRLNASDLDAYRPLADQLNERSDIGAVCIQHEFGLFGGEYGSHLLAFLLRLQIPATCIFHTVLPNPDDKRKKVVQALEHLTRKIIVLTNRSADILRSQYGVEDSKIAVIPHGTHTVPWAEKERCKRRYKMEGKRVLSTFGLLSENKNIDLVLKSLPNVVRENPDVVYLVIGKTHPEIVRREGERYRDQLKELVQSLGLGDVVRFVDEYLDLDILLEYLSLTDLYVFSSKDPHQAVSGTFAYAMSCGCAMVSTPNPHTSEYLDEGKGILLKGSSDPEEMERAINSLLRQPEQLIKMGKNAMATMRASSWENVAIAYTNLFQQYLNVGDTLNFALPSIKLNHIDSMTTDFGMLQFSDFSKPDPGSGYTLDDNSRALLAMVTLWKMYNDEQALSLAHTYLKATQYCQQEDGHFLNYVDIDGKFTGQNAEVNLEDSNGRALWALGYVLSLADDLPKEMVETAEKCFALAMPHLRDYKSPRAISFVLKGIYFYQQYKRDEVLKQDAAVLADELLRIYELTIDNEWLWFEDYLTYANSVLPEAMMYAWLITETQQYREIAETTFDFLLSHYFMKGQIKVISNQGWFMKKNERKFHGEQPIEIAYTIFALDLFYKVTGKRQFAHQLKTAFSWFLGNNHLKQIMYNPANGACYDGLEEHNININQGAESTVCYLMARLIAEHYQRITSTKKPLTEPVQHAKVRQHAPQQQKTTQQPARHMILPAAQGRSSLTAS